jgi:DNA-binding NtrC family response regulator
MNGDGPLILVVEDEIVTSELYATILAAHEIGTVVQCQDSRDVLPLLDSRDVAIILLDLNMPHISGQELLRRISVDHPEVPVIILTGEDKVDTAVECMKIGAFDFMAKPVDENRLVNAVNHALKIRQLQDEVQTLSEADRRELSSPDAFSSILTASPAMYKVFRYVEAVAASPKAVLITGESGTGKELIARSIHDVSGRDAEFVPVNVSGLDDTVFSDTLFGHTKGAFTGAQTVRKGLIEKAAGGTLFLDEIGDLEIGAQIKLLRLLQEQEYYPLGSDTPHRSSARILAATNADLQAKQKEGTFRKDLYYRLISHHVHLPPLRERPMDIALLVNHFVEETAASLRKQKPRIPRELPTLLSTYSFPGNIRELQSLIVDAVSRNSSSVLSLAFFKAYIRDQKSPESSVEEPMDATISYSGEFPSMQEVEEFFISEAMKRSGGNQSIAAELLGVSQSTLSRRLRSKK